MGEITTIIEVAVFHEQNIMAHFLKSQYILHMMPGHSSQGAPHHISKNKYSHQAKMFSTSSPFSILRTILQKRKVSSRCVIIKVVRPSINLCMASMISCSVLVSSELVG